jgi:amino acid adenylation domain-containing protein
MGNQNSCKKFLIGNQEVMKLSTNESKALLHSSQRAVQTITCTTESIQHSLLTAVEQEQIAAWNNTWHSYPQALCIPQLVARQAVATPEAPALVAGKQSLSYGELNRRANQLAHYLRMCGVGPNVLVGICVERSLELVIGLLGILKAGGAYVPIDPVYPPDRQLFMLQDAHISILLTQQRHSTQFACSGLEVVYLDSDAEMLAQQSADELPTEITVTDLVYVLYTSGSTGRPKGVQITHKSLLNLIYWHQRIFAISANDRTTQITSPAFDATGWEIWPYLTIGASVYIVDEHTRVEPVALRDFLVHSSISITFLPTALAERVIGLEWSAPCQLRYLLTGADKLHHYPPATLPFKLINNYGPTEATVVVTSGEVSAVECADVPPTIGRAIDNTQIYILDEQLRQVPIGEVGEIHVGGLGLAVGYLNQPGYTDEKFIANPFSRAKGDRLYKTGDLARYLPDGQIAFVGRVDHQLKIRGYRIEASEIISRLNACPGIETSYVIARDDASGDKRLVAYIVLAEDESITVSNLRQFLGQSLPDYMIPTAFVALDALPLTPNGKVDREALPVPDSENMLRDDIGTTPCTPLEKGIANIVCSLLGIEQVGIDENFFLLGGHSLLGTQIILHITKTFGISLPLRALFEAPTIRQLALEVENSLLGAVENKSM